MAVPARTRLLTIAAPVPELLSDLANFCVRLGEDVAGPHPIDSVYRMLTEAALDQVPGAQFAGITKRVHGKFSTVAASDPRVECLDRIQYRLGRGPCVEAIVEGPVLRSVDLLYDARWPVLGPQAVRSTGMRSILSLRLFLEQHDVEHRTAAGLNLYSTRVGAFDETAEDVARFLVAQGALALLGAVARERADNLERAVRSNRDIGVAIGVLMAVHKITRQQSFDLLVTYSQRTNRKLAELAAEIAETGALPALPVGKRCSVRPVR